MEHKEPACWQTYKKGTQTKTGDIVEEIIHVSEKSIVFLDQHDQLQWEFDEHTCVQGDKAVTITVDLLSQVKTAGISCRGRRRAIGMIASSLSAALDGNADDDLQEHFSRASAFLLAKQNEVQRLVYISVALLTCIAISLAGMIFRASSTDLVIKEFCTVFTSGALGAFVSLAHRFRTLSVDRYTSRLFTGVASGCRILVGALSGVIFLLLQKAGLVLAVAQSNVYAISALAFVAGFSERLIPELVAGIESQLNK